MLTVGSLFAGIGGFDLGLERAGGFRTAWFCEADPFAQRVLRRRWPDVPCYSDVRELVEPPTVDVPCGGFPCQAVSYNGHGLVRPTSGGYGRSTPVSFAYFDPDMCSWRTWQLSLGEDSTMCSPTWPRCGMTRSGTAYALPTQERPTDVSAFTLWPTPNASDAKRVREFSPASLVKTYRSRPRGAAYLTETLMALYGWSHHPTFSEWLMGFPMNWTACEPLATRSSPRSRNGLVPESCDGKAA